MKEKLSFAWQFSKFTLTMMTGLLFLITIFILPPFLGAYYVREGGVVFGILFDMCLVFTAVTFFTEYQPKKEKLDLEKEIEEKQKELNKAEKIVELEKKLKKVETELDKLYKER